VVDDSHWHIHSFVLVDRDVDHQPPRLRIGEATSTYEAVGNYADRLCRLSAAKIGGCR
jgi:hypothetical protein